MPWVPYLVVIAVGLLLAIGGTWQGVRPKFVARKRQQIAEQMGSPSDPHARRTAQIGGYLVTAGGVAAVVIGTIWLIPTLIGAG